MGLQQPMEFIFFNHKLLNTQLYSNNISLQMK